MSAPAPPGFCSVNTGNPKGWLDPQEPRTRQSRAVDGPKYVVLTSVNRDDLPEGGASHYAEVVRPPKAKFPETAVGAPDT
ncbi:MAG: hypothetical protein CM15mP103_04490 [Gammaproteobacteria bacterium]|nr:MAG: hypothetical protein CM15mP103_04490 [Gammaproteobacteria bacterium]